jgi:hypothetical protein
MRLVMRALALSALIAAPGCVFIVKPNEPTPVPTPLVCNPLSEAPKVHVYFVARIERSTVNVADRYGAVMQDVALGLTAVGAEVTTGVLIRADERQIDTPLLAAWGCNLDSPESLIPSDVIRFHAIQRAPAGPAVGCAIDPLITLGAGLTDVVTQYPPGVPGSSGRSVFSGAPDLVLVVHLDHLRRKSGFDDPSCDGARAALLEGDEQSEWLDYGGGLPRDRVVHWIFATEEGVSREAFVGECKSIDGFPSTALDTLEESPAAFYGPMGEALAGAGESVGRLSMCRLLVDTEEKRFLRRGVEEIAGILGLKVDQARFDQILSGGIPELVDMAGTEPPR